MRLCIYSLTIIILPLLLSACSDNGYLLQCAGGHWDLMSRQRPIEEILREKSEPQEVLDRLAKVVELREFAVNALSLPDTGSYRQYVDLERDFAVWNVVAAPELSLELKQWCYPVVGCVTYRGYFDREAARDLADNLAGQGMDVDVYGVKAYSTLQWFDDPVLNTFLTDDELRLAALLFHEMAHQVVYVPGDTSFNESFAKAVEEEGVHRWLMQSGTPELGEKYRRQSRITRDFQDYVAQIRTDLQRVYSSLQDNERKRAAKQDILRRAVADYGRMKQYWDGFNGYDKWMQRGLNNARLSSVATYFDLLPAFRTLLQRSGSDLRKFYQEVKSLGALPERERISRLQELSAASP